MFKTSTNRIVASILAATFATPSFAAIPASAYTYNANGQLETVTEGDGQLHRFEYNAWGRVSGYRPPSPTTAGFTLGRVSMGYGRTEKLIGVTDTKGGVTQYTRNGLLATVSSVTSPDAGTTSFTYDVAGNLKTATTPLGVVMTYAYDAANRLTAVNQKDAQLAFSYIVTGAGAGELGLMTDASGQSAYAYDSLNRMTSRTHTIGGAGNFAGASLTVAQTWSAGRRVSRTYPSGRTVTFSYDAERVASIAVDGVPVVSNVSWEPFGPVQSWQMGAAGTYSRSFDTAGRIVSHTYESGTRQLDWDASNRLTSVTNPDGSQATYLYDGMNRMRSAAENGNPTQAFKFDGNGNRTELLTSGVAYAQVVEASSNRMTAATFPGGLVHNYQYDTAGRALSDGHRTFTWTNAGYLASATKQGVTAQYAYNVLGQRVRKTVGAESRYYVYDDDGVSLLGEYVQSQAGGLVATLNEIVYLDGLPVLVMRGNGVYYVQPDHLGTPRAIKDSAGTVVWSWVSDAYGNGAPNQNPGGVFLFEFNGRMPGQQFDAETGLFYNNARYYDPAGGRYISSDPIGLAGGLGTYGYVGANPLAATDPSGNIAFLVPIVGYTVTGTQLAAVSALSTGYLVAQTETGQRLMNAAASQIPRGEKIYVTYTRQNQFYAGEVYCGRASGYGSPESVANSALFAPRHWALTFEGFDALMVDSITVNRMANRGREQQLIDYHGGAYSVGGRAKNAINGVGDFNRRRPIYIDESIREFGRLPDNSPPRPRLLGELE